MGTFEKVEIEWMNMCVLYKQASRRQHSTECSINILLCDKEDLPQFVIKSYILRPLRA